MECLFLTSYTGETLQIDLFGPLKSPVDPCVLTIFDVFTKLLFAVRLTNITADNNAHERTSFFFQYSYLPKTILSDLRTSFVSELRHDSTKFLEIQL